MTSNRPPITIHYGDRDGATVDNDRTGLPDGCLCPAVRWCGRPPHIQWPDEDCPHHGRGPAERHAGARPVLRLDPARIKNDE